MMFVHIPQIYYRPDTPAVLWLTAPTSAATVLAYVAAGLTVKLVKLKPP
jgi:hypothetical protein